jgi:hypothetical protein
MLQFIGKPPNANFKVYFDRTWTEPMIFDIQDKQALNAWAYMYVFLINKMFLLFL